MNLDELFHAIASSSSEVRFLDLIRRIGLNPLTDLVGADLRELDFSGEDLAGADLRQADLTRAVLRRTILTKADLHGAKIEHADFAGAVFSIEQLETADWGEGAFIDGELVAGWERLRALKWEVGRAGRPKQRGVEYSAKYSIHLGLDYVDPAHYPGMPRLSEGAHEALALESVARDHHCTTRILLNRDATTAAVRHFVIEVSRMMKPNDLLLITFSGYHGLIPVEPGSDSVADETWCLYDRQLITDELYDWLRDFPRGSRIVIVASHDFGTALSRTHREVGGGHASVHSRSEWSRFRPLGVSTEHTIPPNAASLSYEKNRQIYKSVFSKIATSWRKPPAVADLFLLSTSDSDDIAISDVEQGAINEVMETLLMSGGGYD